MLEIIALKVIWFFVTRITQNIHRSCRSEIEISNILVVGKKPLEIKK